MVQKGRNKNSSALQEAAYMKKRWKTDIGFHAPKLMLLETWPLNPFIGDKVDLNIVDIGCNVGVWCQAFMNTYSDQVRSYNAVDPLPGNIGIFEQRLQQGIVPDAIKVKVDQCCMGPSDGSVEINYQRDVSTLASVVLKEMQVGNSTVQNDKKMHVSQLKLDTYAIQKSLEKIDLVKIDVEGYEWDVLEGASSLFQQRNIDLVMFEFGQHQGVLNQSFKQFWDFFSDNGFHLYRQAMGRNFFGLQHIDRYHNSLETFDSMWMIVAAREKHDEERNSPFVIGKYRAPMPVPKNLWRKLGSKLLSN